MFCGADSLAPTIDFLFGVGTMYNPPSIQLCPNKLSDCHTRAEEGNHMVARIFRIGVFFLGLASFASPTVAAADEVLRIFTLEYADCGDMSVLIKHLAGSPLKIASDARTNSLVIVGEEEGLAVIQELLEKLDRRVDRPERRDVEEEEEEEEEIRRDRLREEAERDELEERKKEREHDELEERRHHKLEQKERELRLGALERSIVLLGQKLKMLDAKAEIEKASAKIQIESESNPVAKKLRRLQLEFRLNHELPLLRMEMENEVAKRRGEMELLQARMELLNAEAEEHAWLQSDGPPEAGMVWNEDGEYWEFSSTASDGYGDNYDLVADDLGS